jgi:hypothetical protein
MDIHMYWRFRGFAILVLTDLVIVIWGSGVLILIDLAI